MMMSLLLLCNPVVPHTVARSKFIALDKLIPYPSLSCSLHTTTTEFQLYHPSLDCAKQLIIKMQYNSSLDGFPNSPSVM